MNTYGDIYFIFSLMFPATYKNVVNYRPQGENAIRIELKDGRDLVFTYDTPNQWLLETYRHYEARTL